ncbi:siderophore-interacting protein [Rhodococcus aerolatus]
MASPRPLRVATVLRVEHPAPAVVRVVLGGDGVAGLDLGAHTDHYVKLLLTPAGVTHPEPWDLADIRASRPQPEWPVPRSYTVRAYRDGELTLDVVGHGDAGHGGAGLAVAWAARAQPGDRVHLQGPGGDWAPDPGAAWHLFVADGSALPAVAVSMERLPAWGNAVVVLDTREDEEQPLRSAAGLRVLRVGPDGGGDAVVAALAAAELPVGVPEVFVHGEASMVRTVRRWVRAELGVPREGLSASGYWRRGRTDEAWRAEKPAWKAAVAADDEALPVRA